jgi:hypothetical protein
MAKRKYPSELNTRTVRVHIGDWQMLLELSRKLNMTVAEALHLAITQQTARERLVVTPRTQIPMSFVTPSIAVNGSKVAAFGTKVKGVRYE